MLADWVAIACNIHKPQELGVLEALMCHCVVFAATVIPHIPDGHWGECEICPWLTIQSK